MIERVSERVSERVKQMKFQVLGYIRLPESVFLILILYFMLDGLVLFRKGGFCCIRCLKDGF